MNRVRLVSGERLLLPAHLEGKLARETLSASAVRDIGEAEHGLRLACLIATLKLGEPGARAAREEWDDSYWRRWASIGRVHLAGGLASPGLAKAAEAALLRFGVPCEVRVTAYPAHTPLIGVAKAIGREANTAFVFDFGGTAVKRGIALYGAKGLATIQVLPPLPSPQLSPDRSPEAVAGIIASTVESCGAKWRERTAIGVSIASYVREGHLLEPPHAAYVNVAGIENFAAWLRSRLEESTGARASVQLWHDGTAAALAVSPEANAAVVTLGTFLGAGFAVREAGQMAGLAPGFQVLDASDA